MTISIRSDDVRKDHDVQMDHDQIATFSLEQRHYRTMPFVVCVDLVVMMMMMTKMNEDFRTDGEDDDDDEGVDDGDCVNQQMDSFQSLK